MIKYRAARCSGHAKRNMCAAKGPYKYEMFVKLRTVKNINMQASLKEVTEFADNMQRIARIYHYGLREWLSRKAKEVRYEARTLSGVYKNRVTIFLSRY